MSQHERLLRAEVLGRLPALPGAPLGAVRLAAAPTDDQLADLPPALVIVDVADVLRDEGEARRG